MKKLITDYTFNPATKQIVFNEEFSLNQMLLITNTSNNTIIYNFANPLMGGVISNKVLTLTYDTTSMSANDSIQIYVDDAEVPATESTQWSISNVLGRILQVLSAPLGYDKSLQRNRVTAILESGTVTTVSNVTSLNAMNGVDTRQVPTGINTTAWSLAVRERIS